MNRPRSVQGLAVLVGGTFDRQRLADARTGRLPRNDLTQFVEEFDADLFDFGWLTNEPAGATARAFSAVAHRSKYWSALVAIRAWLSAGGYPVVYSTGEDVGIPFAVLTRLTFWRRQTLILRVENVDYGANSLKGMVWRGLLRFGLDRTDAVLTRANHHAAFLRGLTSKDPTRIVAVGSEVDISFYAPDAAPESGAEAVVPDVPYIVSAGLEMRDYRTLFEAVQSVPVRLVVGAASPWSKDGFDDADLPDNVTVGRFSLPQMRELYRHASLVVLAVLPTERCCGLSVIGEAWAMGRPVVAATDGLADIVRNAGSVVVSPGDVAGLRAEIERLLGDPGERDAVGESGRRYVHRELNLDRFIERIERLMPSPCAPRSARGTRYPV